MTKDSDLIGSKDFKVFVSGTATIVQVILGVLVIKILTSRGGNIELSSWYVVGALTGVVDFVDFGYHRIIPRKFIKKTLKELRILVRTFFTSVFLIVILVSLGISFFEVDSLSFHIIIYSIILLAVKYIEALSIPFSSVFVSKLALLLNGILKMICLLLVAYNISDVLIIFSVTNFLYVIFLFIRFQKFVVLEDLETENIGPIKWRIWVTLVANYFLYKSLFFFVDSDNYLVIKIGLSIQLILLLSSFAVNVFTGVEDEILELIKHQEIRKLWSRLKNMIALLTPVVLICALPLLLFRNELEVITGMPLSYFNLLEIVFIVVMIFFVSLASICSNILIHLGIVTFHYTAIFQVISMSLITIVFVYLKWEVFLLYVPWLSQLYNMIYRPIQLISYLKNTV